MNCPQCNESVECDLATILGLCPKCEHAFCTSCMKAYHGTSDCTGISERREEIEKSEQFIQKEFKMCPGCNTNIEVNN